MSANPFVATSVAGVEQGRAVFKGSNRLDAEVPGKPECYPVTAPSLAERASCANFPSTPRV